MHGVTIHHTTSTLRTAATATGPVAPQRTRVARLHAPSGVTELVALGEFGRVDGYASLEQAIAALRLLTKGDHHRAVAIFERDGRFYAQRLAEASPETARALLAGAFLDLEHRAAERLTAAARHGALRAVVDGATVLRPG